MDLTIVKDYRGDGNAVNDTNKILHLHEENKRLGSCLLNKIKELEELKTQFANANQKPCSSD